MEYKHVIQGESLHLFALCLGAVTLYRCVQHREDEHIFDAFSHSHVHLSMLAHAASRDSVLPPSFWHPTGHLEKMRLRGGEDEEAEEKDDKDEEELRQGDMEVEEGAEVVDKDFAVRLEHCC